MYVQRERERERERERYIYTLTQAMMLPRGDTAFKAYVDRWMEQNEDQILRSQRRWFQAAVAAGPPSR